MILAAVGHNEMGQSIVLGAIVAIILLVAVSRKGK